MCLPNGNIRDYSIIVAKEVVIVFGITAEKDILLIHQYYIAHQKKVPSLVAGFVDHGHHRETAERELREETGCTAKEFVYLGASYRGKYSTGCFHYYLANGVALSGKQELEESEDIDVSFISLSKFLRLLRQSELQDTAQVACAYSALDHLNLL